MKIKIRNNIFKDVTNEQVVKVTKFYLNELIGENKLKEILAATWNAAALLPGYRYTLFHELSFGMALCLLPTFHLLGDPI
ncbi:hypothetical protein IH922_04535 [candidate division KSB1 bacterium]|nr:hypothetical protein [candidate division KSB1 bacterium]